MKRSHISTFPISVRSVLSSNQLFLTVWYIGVCARPHEWVKNTFVLAALLFSKNLFEPQLLLQSVWAFGLFCTAASGAYLVNDIFDRREDLNHPEKMFRPVASGALSIFAAASAATVLLIASAWGGFLVEMRLGFVICAYIFLNFLYSRWLKHIVILDVFAIAAGFVFRVVGGAVAIDVMVSHWLLICTVLLSLFLGFSKRRHELLSLAERGNFHRRVLADYSPLFLDMMIGIVTSATVVAYALYTVSAETVERFQTDRLLFTLPVVLYGVFRYLYLVYHKNGGGNPSRVLLADGPLLATVILWGIASVIIIYLGNY